MPDEDEPPTRPQHAAAAEARAAEARVRRLEQRRPMMSIATTPAPLDYASMAALLASVPRVAVDADDLEWFELGDDAKKLLALVDGKRTVAEIAASLDATNVVSILTMLEQGGVVARTTK